LEYPLDAIDLTILRTLVANARVTFADLAEAVGLSGPSTAERVRKLEERGVIGGYHADLDPGTIGLDLTAFVSVSLESPAHRASFLTGLESLPGVVECHHVAGDDDYLIKVHVAGTHGLETFVSDGLKALPGIARTRTTVVLSSPFERPLSVGDEVASL
jgi:Lrp/AsnC family transcriptional regulator, leucine-responsive regulatory protein